MATGMEKRRKRERNTSYQALLSADLGSERLKKNGAKIFKTVKPISATKLNQLINDYDLLVDGNALRVLARKKSHKEKEVLIGTLKYNNGWHFEKHTLPIFG